MDLTTKLTCTFALTFFVSFFVIKLFDKPYVPKRYAPIFEIAAFICAASFILWLGFLLVKIWS